MQSQHRKSQNVLRWPKIRSRWAMKNGRFLNAYVYDKKKLLIPPAQIHLTEMKDSNRNALRSSKKGSERWNMTFGRVRKPNQRMEENVLHPSLKCVIFIDVCRAVQTDKQLQTNFFNYDKTINNPVHDSQMISYKSIITLILFVAHEYIICSWLFEMRISSVVKTVKILSQSQNPPGTSQELDFFNMLIRTNDKVSDSTALNQVCFKYTESVLSIL